MKVQDASGKDWVFQFRFWPNNNSRMYVLEGVTPCIQAMQLQAGDTGMFLDLNQVSWLFGALQLKPRVHYLTLLLQVFCSSIFSN